MAIFNLEYYDGKDHYSDGLIEDQILELLKTDSKTERELSKQDRYAFYYHLSPLRENILNWYPFKEGCKILEVGAGCGAITGLLCNKAKRVVSVELSRKRAEINYERNRKFNNLEIIVGNMNNVSLDKDFDYIVLNGVLEYAISFTNTDNPYVDFLKNMSLFLKKDGKLLLAIENRLGCKYFSGSYEDHTNTFFLGLNKYVGNNTVRTFSKSELIDIMVASGFENFRFYYPYPDYKFPIEVFTDETINNGQYGRKLFNPEKERIQLFDEKKVLDSFAEEGILGTFANSFLVEASPDCICASFKVTYAKMNTSRKDCFRTNTIIIEEQGECKVLKTIGHPKALSHLDTIIENEKMLTKAGYNYIIGLKKDNCIVYPYIGRDAVADEILDLLHKNNIKKIKEIVHEIADKLFEGGEERTDFYSADFQKYFGAIEGEETLVCVKDQNIDVICNNIYRIKDQYLFIDGEWVCHFWIPVKFIVWRLINELFCGYPELNEHINLDDFLTEFEISPEEKKMFTQWAIYFAEKYVADENQPSFLGDVYPISLNDWLREQQVKNVILTGLYIDSKDGFSESNKLCKEMYVDNGRFNIEFDLSQFSNINSLRWDPLEGGFCCCTIHRCMVDGVEVAIKPLNSELFDNSIFLTPDPQFFIGSLKGEKIQTLMIQGNFSILSDKSLVQAIQSQNNYFVRRITSCEARINEMCDLKTELENQIQLYQNQEKQYIELIQNCEYKTQALQRHIKALSYANATYRIESQQLEHDLQATVSQKTELLIAKEDLEKSLILLRKQLAEEKLTCKNVNEPLCLIRKMKGKISSLLKGKGNE